MKRPLVSTLSRCLEESMDGEGRRERETIAREIEGRDVIKLDGHMKWEGES